MRISDKNPVIEERPAITAGAKAYNYAKENVNKEDIKQRTKRLALAIIKFLDTLPHTRSSDVIGKQLLRSATSVGSNYRSACRARSKADFLSKLGIVEEEADETIYWLELLVGSGQTDRNSTAPLMKEADEILSIVIASIRTGRGSQ